MSYEHDQFKFEALYRKVESSKEDAAAFLQEIKRSTAEYVRSAVEVINYYSSAHDVLQEAHKRNQTNPDQLRLLEENLADDLSKKVVEILRDCQRIYTQLLAVGALFGGATKDQALFGAIRVIDFLALIKSGSDDFYTRRLDRNLRDCFEIRCVLHFAKIRFGSKHDDWTALAEDQFTKKI